MLVSRVRLPTSRATMDQHRSTPRASLGYYPHLRFIVCPLLWLLLCFTAHSTSRHDNKFLWTSYSRPFDSHVDSITSPYSFFSHFPFRVMFRTYCNAAVLLLHLISNNNTAPFLHSIHSLPAHSQHPPLFAPSRSETTT